MKRIPLHDWTKDCLGFDLGMRAEMERYQLERIRALIEYVTRRSRFYADLYRGLALPRSLEEFAQYPSFSATELRERGPELLCVAQGEIARVVTLFSSGTSACPKRVYFCDDELEQTRVFFIHGMRTLCRASDRLLILFPGRRPASVGALLKQALERMGVRVFLAEPEQTKEEPEALVKAAAERLIRERIQIVCGPPQLLAAVAAKAPVRTVRAVLSSSDLLSSQHREQMERSWGCEIFDHYGMTETGLGAAVECEAHDGMHIRENDLYYECVDSDGRRQAEGEEGELLVTTLRRRGMPMLRYRSGDTGRLSDTVCSCGSGLRRIHAPRRMERENPSRG